MYSEEVKDLVRLHEVAIKEAFEQDDSIKAMEHQLEQLALLDAAEHKELQFRYDVFYGLHGIMMVREPWPLSTSFVTLLTNKFMKNPGEPIFVRAIAANILGRNFEKNLLNPLDRLASINHFQSTITFCRTAATNNNNFDRERKVELGCLEGSLMSVGEFLDSLEESSIFHRDYLINPHDCLMNFLLRTTSTDGPCSQPGVAEEVIQFWSTEDIDVFVPRPPTITSDVLAKIRALPVNEQIYLVYQDKTYEPATAYELRAHCEEVRNRLLNGVQFRIFAVDMERYNVGEHTKVFRMIQMLYCHKNSSRPQQVLSMIIHACQNPSNILPGISKAQPPQRPRQLLFQSRDDANHPQIKLFLSMMGYDDDDQQSCSISTADRAMVELLEDTKNEAVTNSKIYNKEVFPHHYDLVKGIKCGNCELIGPKLKKCPCGKAYYCSSECQNAQWKAHKKEHKKALVG